MSQNVLLIGSGGRESAIVRALVHSDQTIRIFAPTQNGGMILHTEGFPESINSMYHGTASWSAFNNIDLVIVGPEQPLVEGITDQILMNTRCRVFGLTKELARLEADKWDAKKVMQNLGIPTAPGALYDLPNAIKQIRTMGDKGVGHIVLKYVGLMGGKGVHLPQATNDAIAHVEECFVGKEPGQELMLFEERLRSGVEVSLTAFVDGDNYVLLPPAMDFKRAYDGDAENDAMTGGMGAIAPAPTISNEQWEALGKRIVAPIVEWGRKKNPRHGIRGCLYFGLYITENGNPYVLEMNVRLGDPETQAILPLLKINTYDLFHACATGTLQELVGKEGLGKTLPYQGCSVVVTVASESYPKPHTGDPICVPSMKERYSGVQFIHGNTTREDEDRVFSTGGRICYLFAKSFSHEDARNRVYAYLQNAGFTNARWRTDIGASVPKITLSF